ncbi:hypothetical protein C9374_014069 [Naegleria lovaniensis]|uniref:Uncharacterized protein n=1 Tax=Naegleria lovaniensis TaxID=51637 RepID=A0AA88H1I6_NAELO|nr:uncharacterized protein C9374_014069 [Naegleria lovaniensis]KAG2389509.1 hypothetical protein C9374_014069 [Naegleria lovaniensis]
MKSSSSFSFVSAVNLLIFIIILLHSTFNTYKFGSVNGEPTVVPLPNIDFSEMYPFIQHIDTYISYKTQIESFPNMLLLIYFPWDSITMYEVRQALIEVYKEFSQTDRLFTEYNGELLNGFTLVPITSKSYDNNTSDNKFVVRAINYHNVQDKDLKEKLITLTSPSIRFISSLATERHYFYSQYSSTMLKRFINISLNRKILTDDYRDVCINESTRNEQARQNALNNILEDEQVLIGYFPDQSKDEQLYMEKFYNATFNYVQPLRLKT